MDSSENKIFTQIAEEYYVTCEAEEQSGKTAWLGIMPDESTKPVRWRVSMRTAQNMSFIAILLSGTAISPRLVRTWYWPLTDKIRYLR